MSAQFLWPGTRQLNAHIVDTIGQEVRERASLSGPPGTKTRGTGHKTKNMVVSLVE